MGLHTFIGQYQNGDHSFKRIITIFYRFHRRNTHIPSQETLLFAKDTMEYAKYSISFF